MMCTSDVYSEDDDNYSAPLARNFPFLPGLQVHDRGR